MGAQASSNNEVWNKLPENKTLREEEYTLLKGNWQKNIMKLFWQLMVIQKLQIMPYIL